MLWMPGDLIWGEVGMHRGAKGRAESRSAAAAQRRGAASEGGVNRMH